MLRGLRVLSCRCDFWKNLCRRSEPCLHWSVAPSRVFLYLRAVWHDLFWEKNNWLWAQVINDISQIIFPLTAETQLIASLRQPQSLCSEEADNHTEVSAALCLITSRTELGDNRVSYTFLRKVVIGGTLCFCKLDGCEEQRCPVLLGKSKWPGILPSLELSFCPDSKYLF